MTTGKSASGSFPKVNPVHMAYEKKWGCLPGAKETSNKEIAAKLFVTEATVKFHLRTVFSKLNIDRRSKLARILE